MKTPFLPAGGLVFLAACQAASEFQKPDSLAPAAWVEAVSADSSEPEPRWWSRFQDTVLDALVERALQQNPDLEIARARVREARALRDVARGGNDVQLDAFAGVARSKSSESTASGRFQDGNAHDLFDAGFDARWEVDVFGAQANRIAAAEDGLESADMARRETVVSLAGEVAREYVELRGTQRQLAITRSNLATQRDTAQLVASQFRAGMATGLDEARALAQADATAARIPDLEGRARSAIHRLAILCGETPGALIAELEVAAEPPTPPTEVRAGLPADVLRRRPDVARAESELSRAYHLTTAARADLYPRVSLGATLGFSSEELSQLLDAKSLGWSAGGGLLAPLLNGGALRANVRAEEAREDEARSTWKKTVLQALSEVEDEIAALRYERDRHVSLSASLESSRRAAVLARELQARGLADFLDVLVAERVLLQAESEEVDSRTALSAHTIALYKALGGLPDDDS